MCLVSIACIFQALYDTCQEIKDRSRKSRVMGCWVSVACFLIVHIMTWVALVQCHAISRVQGSRSFTFYLPLSVSQLATNCLCIEMTLGHGPCSFGLNLSQIIGDQIALGDNPFFTWMNIFFEWIILFFFKWMNSLNEYFAVFFIE